MIFNFLFKPLLAMLILIFTQFVLAQSPSTGVEQQSVQAESEESTKLTDKARVVIEWSTFFDSTSMTKTEISIDQKVVCKVNADSKICDVKTEPGKREIMLNTNLDFGTFSERYDLEAGKRYKLEIVLNKKNFWVDTLFLGMPVSAIFNEKGKTASLKFELVSVSDERHK